MSVTGDGNGRRSDGGRRFELGSLDWTQVDPALTRSLLRAIDRPDDAAGLHRAFAELAGDSSEREVLARAAAHLLGRAGISRRHWDKVVPVLIADWLPSDDAAGRLDELARDGLPAITRARLPKERAEKVRFLQRAGVADRPGFRVNLIRAFDRSYRRPRRRKGSTGTAGERPTGHYPLRGMSSPPRHPEPFAHVDEAEHHLRSVADRRRRDTRGALISLPTGAGKTDVAVGRVLERMASDRNVRVIWVADQVALLEQAANRFVGAAAERPVAFECLLRLFAESRTEMWLFHPDRCDIACITRQSISRSLRRDRGRRRINSWLRRPLIVVVDEAHHAAADTYRRFLDLLGPEHELIGLSATPVGPGYKQDLLDERFPPALRFERSREELTDGGVLASFKIDPRPTGYRVTGSEREHLLARRRRDVPESVLERMDDPERNAAIVSCYLENQVNWGRTLLFAPSIPAAESLTDLLYGYGTAVRSVHSQSGQRIDPELRTWFADTPQAVIVSVGMLLEGVDLPAARTALIARPTTSPIVANQMIGRVLRGTRSGGEATANVIYMQDDFSAFAELLDAERPWDGPDAAPGPDDEIGPEVSAALRDALEEARAAAADTGDPAADDELAFGLDQRWLVGRFELATGVIPVLDNQIEGFMAFIGSIDGDDPQTRFSLGDQPPPQPARQHLEALRVEMLAGRRPELIRFDEPEPLAPIETARQIINLTDEDERAAVLRDEYEDLWRAIYPSYPLFAAAVRRAERELLTDRRSPEGPPGGELAGSVPDPDRSLEPAKAHTKAMIEAHPELYAGYDKPDISAMDIRWSRGVKDSYYANWRRTSQGGDRIIVNELLRRPQSEVGDDIIAALLWHEVVHAMTPGHGHDEVFEQLEDRWHGVDELNAELVLLDDRSRTS
jgi:superfamily II DNA or RNA helicase